jgi:hypothetical protein
MAIRLTKTTKIIFAISIVVLSIALGFLVWTVTQQDRLDPDDADASCPSGCYYHAAAPGNCTGPGGCIFVCSNGTNVPAGNGGYSSPDEYCKSLNPNYWVNLECDPCVPSEPTPPPPDPDPGTCSSIPNLGDTGPPGSSCDASNCGPQGCLIDGINYTFKCGTLCYDASCGASACTYTPPAPTCGVRPSGADSLNIRNYQKQAQVIGPFTQSGKVVLYYKSLEGAGVRPIFTLVDPLGNAYNIKMPALDGNHRARVVTDIRVNAGQTITLVNANDDYASPPDLSCAPSPYNVAPLHLAIGWIDPVNNYCGTTFAGPPSGYEPFVPKNVSSEVTWAASAGREVISKQCWADWPEWYGDYDFNDYFLQISTEAIDEPIIPPPPDPDPIRPDMCQNLTFSDNPTRTETERALQPGESVTFTLRSKDPAVAFGLSLFNAENLDSSGSMKAICYIKSGEQVLGACPTGTNWSHLMFWNRIAEPPNSSPTASSSTFTLTYEQMFINDLNWSGSKVEQVLLAGYFYDPDWNFSIANDNCKLRVFHEDIPEDIPEIPPPVEEVPEPEEPPLATGPGGTIPQTSIFDGTLSRIAAGFVLISFGVVVYAFPSGIFNRPRRVREPSYKYRDRFEKKVANR